jgi:dTDP-4-amino-4,6-dideoxygalactose transaminase
VLTTPLSAFATTLAILRAGGVPVFVDVDACGQLDLNAAERLLEAAQNGERVRWMVPVHLFGHCLDLDRLEALRDRFGLQIVEDCAQSIGATWRERPCGSVGLAATTSFYPTKNLGALGDGGALLTNDAALAKAAKQWRDYGQSEKYVHSVSGLNSRLDELQAALLRDALLPRLAGYTAARQAVGRAYDAGIQHGALQMVVVPEGCGAVRHLYPLLVDGSREGFMQHLKRHGVMVGIHYPQLISDQPALEGEAWEQFGDLSMARKFAAQEVSLPMHPHLSAEQVQRVIDACNGWDGG